MRLYILSLSLLLTSFTAHAELTSLGKQKQQQNQNNANPYGYGQGNGSSYYNNPNYYQQGNQGQQGARSQKISQATKTGGDLLWLFTGSEAPLRDQVKSGFHSDGQSTFGNRIFNLFLGIMYGRFVTPIENKLGSIGDKYAQSFTAKTAQNQYNQNSGAQNCYNCAQQKSPNPYTKNPNAIDRGVFGGDPRTSAGGIKK